MGPLVRFVREAPTYSLMAIGAAIFSVTINLWLGLIGSTFNLCVAGVAILSLIALVSITCHLVEANRLADPCQASSCQVLVFPANAFERASERARQLLMESLTPAQQMEYTTHNRFTVRGSDRRHYTIHCHGDYNVRRGGRQYCAEPLGLPSDDVYLAQKLCIETNVNEFKRVANMRLMTSRG